MDEIWRDIPSLPGYQASSLGRIRRTFVTGRNHPPRILKTSRFSHGYLALQTVIARRRVSFGVHRLVCEAFHGPAPDATSQARHKDGTRDNNVPDNLAWGSPRENAKDRREHGRDHLGANHCCAKLTAEQVLEIRALAETGAPRVEIAARFGINKHHCNKIIARTAWAHLTPPVHPFLLKRDAA